MFSISGMDKTSVNVLRHDMLLSCSEEPLFTGKDRILFPAYVELPCPIYLALKTTKDRVIQLLNEKVSYFKSLETKRKRYKFDLKNIAKKKILQREYVYLPKHMLEFYKKKDPDPYFKCDYNYYYTGGIVEHLQMHFGDYLLWCNSENSLCLIDLHDTRNISLLNCECTSPIFNIRSTIGCNDPLLVLREQHCVNLVKLIGMSKLSKVLTVKFSAPILDAKLHPNEHKILGIVQSNRTLNVRDVETNRTTYSFRNTENGSDNFQQFQFWNENSILLMDRFMVKILDYRTKVEEKSFDPYLIKCNSLCNLGVLGNDLFLASRHYVIKADLRFVNGFSYYSHMLNVGPCYMDFTTKDDDVFMCLASHNQESKVLFTGESPYTIPFKVPDILDTVKECRLRHSSLGLMDGLEGRFNFATAGLKVVNLNNEVFIYSVNGLGDVFSQKVTDEPPDIEKPVKILLDHINKINKPKPVLYLTHVEEMGQARFCLNNKPNESNLEKYKSETKADEFIQVFRPRYSKNNITSKLAADFLSVWDDPDEEEEEEEDLPELPVVDKVNDWIQTHNFSDNDTSMGFINI